jgi:hypothetical protein
VPHIALAVGVRSSKIHGETNELQTHCIDVAGYPDRLPCNLAYRVPNRQRSLRVELGRELQRRLLTGIEFTRLKPIESIASMNVLRMPGT